MPSPIPKPTDPGTPYGTLALGRRVFTVTKHVDPTIEPALQTYYRLRGVRGASYFTLHNLRRPEYLFVCNDKPSFGHSTPFDGMWLMDKDGALRIA